MSLEQLIIERAFEKKGKGRPSNLELVWELIGNPDVTHYTSATPCPKCGCKDKHLTRKAYREEINVDCYGCKNKARRAKYATKEGKLEITKQNAKWTKSAEGRAYMNDKAMHRHAAKLQRTPKWNTEADDNYIKAMYRLAVAMSKMAGEPYEVDHVVPLQGRNVSGLHTPSNLQIIPKRINIAKLNKWA